MDFKEWEEWWTFPSTYKVYLKKFKNFLFCKFQLTCAFLACDDKCVGAHNEQPLGHNSNRLVRMTCQKYLKRAIYPEESFWKIRTFCLKPALEIYHGGIMLSIKNSFQKSSRRIILSAIICFPVPTPSAFLCVPHHPAEKKKRIQEEHFFLRPESGFWKVRMVNMTMMGLMRE